PPSATTAMVARDHGRRVPVSKPKGKGSGSRSFESAAAAVPGASPDQYGTALSGQTSPKQEWVGPASEGSSGPTEAPPDYPRIAEELRSSKRPVIIEGFANKSDADK